MVQLGLLRLAPHPARPGLLSSLRALVRSFRNLIYIEEFRRRQAEASIFEAPPFKMHYAGGWSTIGERSARRVSANNETPTKIDNRIRRERRRPSGEPNNWSRAWLVPLPVPASRNLISSRSPNFVLQTFLRHDATNPWEIPISNHQLYTVHYFAPSAATKKDAPVRTPL